MKEIVVDASAAYDLLTEGQCQPKIRGASELIAPDLIVAELLNARWKVRRAGLKAPALELMLDFLDRLRLVPAWDYAHEAAALSERLDHPVYDCLYVAVSQRERARLLTVDERLIKKLQSPPLAPEVLGPT